MRVLGLAIFALGCGPKLPVCPDAPFTVSPMQLGDFDSITPLGNLNPSSHVFPTDHVYFGIRDDGQLGTPMVPVVAPGHVWIVHVDRFDRLEGSGGSATKYKVEFSPCDSVEAYLDHVTTLDAALTARLDLGEGDCQQYSTGGRTFRFCQSKVNVELQAGEAIGTTGGPGEHALDFGAIDQRSPELVYANSARLHDPNAQRHTVCPIDEYSAEAATPLRARLGGFHLMAHRTAAPVCGETAQDRPGTAQGNWYARGADAQHEDPHLALVHDNIDPTIGAFSIGTTLPPSPGVWRFVPTSAGYLNREFSQVTPDSHTYCYDAFVEGSPPGAGHLVLQLLSASTLQIERQNGSSCGAGPWTFGGGAIDFDR